MWICFSICLVFFNVHIWSTCLQMRILIDWLWKFDWIYWWSTRKRELSKKKCTHSIRVDAWIARESIYHRNEELSRGRIRFENVRDDFEMLIFDELCLLPFDVFVLVLREFHAEIYRFLWSLQPREKTLPPRTMWINDILLLQKSSLHHLHLLWPHQFLLTLNRVVVKLKWLLIFHFQFHHCLTLLCERSIKTRKKSVCCIDHRWSYFAKGDFTILIFIHLFDHFL